MRRCERGGINALVLLDTLAKEIRSDELYYLVACACVWGFGG